MGLELHEINLLPEGGRSFKLLSLMRLSGADGLIAKYLSTHQDQDLEQWVMGAPEVALLFGEPSRNVAVLCSTGCECSGGRVYSEIVSIAGSSRGDQTDLVLMQRGIGLTPLPDGSLAEDAFPGSEYTMESLALKGGTTRRQHSWKLVTSELKIGGVIR